MSLIAPSVDFFTLNENVEAFSQILTRKKESNLIKLNAIIRPFKNMKCSFNENFTSLFVYISLNSKNASLLDYSTKRLDDFFYKKITKQKVEK